MFVFLLALAHSSSWESLSAAHYQKLHAAFDCSVKAPQLQTAQL